MQLVNESPIFTPTAPNRYVRHEHVNSQGTFRRGEHKDHIAKYGPNVPNHIVTTTLVRSGFDNAEELPHDEYTPAILRANRSKWTRHVGAKQKRKLDLKWMTPAGIPI